MVDSLDARHDVCALDGAGLRSAVDGLYEEIDKLATANGGAPLSDVAIEQVRATGEAAANGVALDSIAAGALQRMLAADQLAAVDARLLLGQVLHGLDRARTASRSAGVSAGSSIDIAHTPGSAVDRDFELWLAARG